MAQPAHANRTSDKISQATYIPALDGVRAASILLVVLSHLGLDRVLPGAFGVTLFFFISGYLITRQLLRASIRIGRINLPAFYLRRALRLMPAACTYILVAGLLYELAGGRISFFGWAAAFGYGANFYDLWVGYHSTLPGVRHPFNILWSLAIEEHFYILWPLVLGLVWRWRWLFWALIGFCLATMLWRWALFDSCVLHHTAGFCAPVNANPIWRTNQLYLSTDARADSIAWGACLAVAEQQDMGVATLALRSRLAHAAAWAVLAASFLIPGDFARFVIRTTLQGLALLLLVPAAIRMEGLLHRWLVAAPAIILGRLSYSVYLWHWAALGIADWAAGGNRVEWVSLAIPLSVALSVLSYRCVEQPMLRLRRLAGSNVAERLLF
jgi:peptidoglycan/LPS O-acetylase OafA/YrhL